MKKKNETKLNKLDIEDEQHLQYVCVKYMFVLWCKCVLCLCHGKRISFDIWSVVERKVCKRINK